MKLFISICMLSILTGCTNYINQQIPLQVESDSLKIIREQREYVLKDLSEKLDMLEEKKPEDIQGEYIRYFFGGGGGWGGYDADPGCIAFFLNEGKPFYRLSEQMANYQNTKDSLYEIRIHRKSIDLVDYFKLKNAYLKSGIVEMSLVATIKPFTCMDCDHFFYDSRIDGKQILVSWLSEWHDADDDYVPDTTCTVDSNKFYHSKFLYLARKLSGFEPEDTEKFRIHFGIEE